jgi:hypothetical protein
MVNHRHHGTRVMILNIEAMCDTEELLIVGLFLTNILQQPVDSVYMPLRSAMNSIKVFASNEMMFECDVSTTESPDVELVANNRSREVDR